jgi:Cu+-exporting ATPase
LSSAEGVVDGHALVVGHPALLADWAIHLRGALERARRGAEASGQTAIAAGWDGDAKAAFFIADTIKPTSVEAIEQLKAHGLRPVLLTGDNETTARAVAADLGLAIGTGTDVAIEASDLTLVSGDLRGAADAILLSRATLRTIKQNLGWAFGYNLAALPPAALGLLNPAPMSAGPLRQKSQCVRTSRPIVGGRLRPQRGAHVDTGDALGDPAHEVERPQR